MIDTHCHLQFRAYENDREAVIARCAEKNVIMNVVGTQKDTNQKAVELAEKYQNIYATIGLHPIHLHATEVDEEESSFLSREEDFDEEFYDELAKSEKVIAIGECGLELYHIPVGTGLPNLSAMLEKQKEIFVKQYNFALKHDLPVVIHVRDPEPQGFMVSAYEEMVEVLNSLLEEGAPKGREVLPLNNTPRQHSAATPLKRGITGVIHCFSGNWEQAEKFLNLGLYLGFTGVITFPARKTNPQPTLDLLEVVEKCPLDRILVETDAPYLAPQAYRGQRCEPWMVEEAVKKIAEVKNFSLEEVEKITVENTRRLFKKMKM